MWNLKREKLRESVGGGASLERIYEADYGTGKAKAAVAGFVKGAAYAYSGIAFYVGSVDVESSEGIDLVTVMFAGALGSTTWHASEKYNDGKIRVANEEEWTIEGDLQLLPAVESVSAEGHEWTSQDNWGKDENDQVEQPTGFLVWRKWLNKATVAAPTKTLPTTVAEAVNAMKTYLPGENGNYEGSPPKLNVRLANYPQFLCVQVALEDDGDLVCRIARYKYVRLGWAKPPAG